METVFRVRAFFSALFLCLLLALAAGRGAVAQEASGGDSGQTAAPRRIRIGGNVEAARAIYKPAPEFPKKAKKKHIQGHVILHALIGKDGRIADLKVASGDPILAKAAVKAVSKWRFKPLLLKGQPVDVDTQIDVNFTLDDAPATAASSSADATATASQGPDAAPAVAGASAAGSASAGLQEPLDPQRPTYTVGGAAVSAPVPVYQPDPPYSEVARRKRFQGTVVMSIVVDAQGKVRSVQVTKPLGMGLDENAVDTVKTWRFKPALRDGVPVAARMLVQVTFRLFK